MPLSKDWLFQKTLECIAHGRGNYHQIIKLAHIVSLLHNIKLPKSIVQVSLDLTVDVVDNNI